MARFTIYSPDGSTARYTGAPVYHGSHLKPAYLEFREIASHDLIPWQVGDYVDYGRTGFRYKLYSIPYPAKQAVKNSNGDSFVYRDVQLFCATKDLEIAPFRDLVISDNTIHFTTLPNVSTFEDVYGIGRRIQANLDAFYGEGTWMVVVTDGGDPDIREVLLQTKEFSVSDGTCLDALAQIYSLWKGIGWVYSVVDGVNTISIGRPNVQDKTNTTSVFAYGIGNGIKLLKKEQSGKNDVATRIYAYGSTRNLVARYYNNITPAIKDSQSVYIPNLMIPLSHWGETEGLKDARKAYLEASPETVAKYGLRTKTIYFDGTGDYEDIYPSIETVTAGDLRAAMQPTDQYYPSINFAPDVQRVDEVAAAENPADDGVLSDEGGGKYAQKVVLVGENYNSTYNLAPGQPSAKIYLDNIASAGNITVAGKVRVTPELTGYITPGQNMAAVSLRIWIEIGGVKYAERGAKVTRGKNGIYQLSMEPFEINTEDTGTVKLCGYLFIARSDSAGNLPVGINIIPGNTTLSAEFTPSDSFKVQIRQIGFDINQQQSAISGGLCTIAFKSGWCAGREFTVKKCTYQASNDRWVLTVARQNDESIGQYFPNSIYRIEAGDRFVLTDLAMPDVYVTSAMERLYRRASETLAALSIPKIIYEPEIDAKALALNPEIITEGMYMPIRDNDLIEEEVRIIGGEYVHQEWVLIDSIEIDEGAAEIPTYKITLQDEKRESFISRLTREAGRNQRNITEITIRDLRSDVEEAASDISPEEEIAVRVTASHPIIGYKHSFAEEPVNIVTLLCETTGIDSPTFQWYFRGEIDWVEIPGATDQAYTVDPDSELYYLDGEIVEDFRCVVSGDESLSDSVQIMKVLSDAMTVSLSNPAHIFEAGTRYAVAAEDRSDIIGYRGVERFATTVKMDSLRFLNLSQQEIAVTYTGGRLKDSQGQDLTDSQGRYLVIKSGAGANIVDDDKNVMMAVEVVNNGTDGAYLVISVTEYMDIPAGVIEIPVVVRDADAAQGVSEKTMNLYYSWGLALQGNASFTSVVFKRSAEQPETPTGGDYEHPVPEGWSDGVPSENPELTLWMSMRIFSANGLYPQEDEWSTPTGAFDTADVDFEWSTEEEIPAAPNPGYDPSHDKTPPIWHNDATDAIWMAIRKKAAGVWGDWEVFRCKGEDGSSPLFADLSNEADGLAVGSDGILDVQTALTTKVSLWYGDTAETITGLTPSIPSALSGKIVPSYPNGVADGTIVFTISANTNLNAYKSIEIPIAVSSERGQSGVTFTIIPVKEGEDGTVFVLVPSADSIKGTRGANNAITYSPSSVTCARYMRKGSGELTASTYGTLKYSVDDGTTIRNYTGAVNASSAAAVGRIIFYWYAANGSSVIDRETIPIIVDGENGAAGESALEADLDNEADGLAVGSDGILTASATLTTHAHIFLGNTAQNVTAITEDKTQIPSSFRSKFTITKSGLNTTEATVTIAISASTSSSINFAGVSSVRIPLTIACAAGSKTVVYTLIIVKDGEDGAVFMLQPSADVVKGARGTDNAITYSPTAVSCTRKMRKGSGALSDATSIGNLYVIKNASASSPTETAYTDGTNVNVSEFASHGKVIFVWKLNGVVIDRETVPVVTDGAKGDNGYSTVTLNLYKRYVGSSAPAKPSATLTYTFATNALAPADSGSNPATYDGWSRDIPSGIGPVFITTAQKEANTATVSIVSADWSTPLRMTGEDGLQGKIMRGINEWVSGHTLPDGSEYQGLSDTEAGHIYFDVVWYTTNGTRNYYYCKKYIHNNVLAKNITPGTNADVWVLASNYEFIATDVLLAANAFIDVLTGNGFYLYKGSDDGTVIVGGAQGGTGTIFFAGTNVGKDGIGGSGAGSISKAPFRVLYSGKVYASDAVIAGSIEASGQNFDVTGQSGTKVAIKSNNGLWVASGTTFLQAAHIASLIVSGLTSLQNVVASGTIHADATANGAQHWLNAAYGNYVGKVHVSSQTGFVELTAKDPSNGEVKLELLNGDAQVKRGNGNYEGIVTSPTIKHSIPISESDYEALSAADKNDATKMYYII